MKNLEFSPLLKSKYASSDLFWMLALVLIQIILYGSGIFNGFVGDDRTYFIDNDLYNNLGFRDLFQLFIIKTNYWGEHFPLRDYLNILQKNLFSLNPLLYHLFSFTLFSGFIFAIYKIFRIADEESQNAKFFCFLATFFYISHPALVECVSYISGQKDLLCGIFTALTIIFFLKYSQSQSFLLLLAAGIFYYAALFSKSVAIVNFLALIVIYYYFEKNKNYYRDGILWLVFNLPAFGWILYTMEGLSNGLLAKTDQSILLQLIDPLKIIGWQFFILFKIYPRSFGYPFVENKIDFYFFLGLFVCLSFLIFFIFSKDKFVRGGILLWFIFLIPILRILYSASNAGVYDRYLFLPLLGLSFIIYGILKRYNHKYILAVFALIVSLNSMATIFSNSNFRNDIANTSNSYRAYPDWSRASFGYAYTLIEGGKLVEAEHLILQEKTFQKPNWVIPYFRGWIALERGEMTHAEELLRAAALRASTGGYYPFPNVPLARTLLQSNQDAAANIFLQRVLVLGGKANPVEYYKAKSLLKQ